MAAADMMIVPVIDLANFPMELEKLAAAVTGLGGFRVVNHGMPPALMAEMKAIARSLFQLPTETKLRSVNNKLHAIGYTKQPELKFFEGFSIYDASSKSDIHSFCSILDITAPQSETVAEYIAKLHDLTINVACKVAESVDFNLAGFPFDEWPCLARLNCYNFMVEEDVGCFGATNHTDSGFLTVLQEDECVGGLEIMDSNGSFVSIDPVPGTFFVNIGDVGKVWSNGRLKTVKHRVVCREAKQRISIAMFLLTANDGRVEPEAAFVDLEHPRIYQTFIYNEYRKLRDATGCMTGEILPLL